MNVNVLVLHLYLIIQCHLVVSKGHFTVLFQATNKTKDFKRNQKHVTHEFIELFKILSLCAPWKGILVNRTNIASKKVLN